MLFDNVEVGNKYFERFSELSKIEFEECIRANTCNIDIDEPIYRIFPYNRIMQAINEKKLCFVRPRIWGDPNENFYLRRSITVDDTILSFEKIEDKFFAQCWSKNRECDGLWRAYSDNTRALSVQVKSSVRRIMQFFYDLGVGAPNLFYYCGAVTYHNDSRFIKLLKQNIFDHSFSDKEITDTFIKTLLMKRKAFSYEKEVRFIFMRPSKDYIEKNAKNPWRLADDFFFVNIDINDCFEEIKINPWIDRETALVMKNAINESGYNNKVYQSNIYEKFMN